MTRKRQKNWSAVMWWVTVWLIWSMERYSHSYVWKTSSTTRAFCLLVTMVPVNRTWWASFLPLLVRRNFWTLPKTNSSEKMRQALREGLRSCALKSVRLRCRCAASSLQTSSRILCAVGFNLSSRMFPRSRTIKILSWTWWLPLQKNMAMSAAIWSL